MKFIIISGPEATGKTAIGKELALRMNYQYLSKDMIKEALFDSQSHSTWDHKWYEEKAKTIFFETILEFVSQDKSAIIESNFIEKDKLKFKSILNNSVDLCEIHVIAKGFKTFRRFVIRNETGKRHKGHHDRRWYLTIFTQDLLSIFHIEWNHKPVSLNKKLLVIDNSNFNEIDYEKVIDFINDRAISINV